MTAEKNEKDAGTSKSADKSGSAHYRVEIYYSAPQLLPAQIVKMVLLEKSASFSEKLLDVYEAEDLSPVAGGHYIPEDTVLYVRGRTVCADLEEIFRDIDAAYPRPSIFPEGESEQELHRKWMEKYARLPLIQMTYAFLPPMKRKGYRSMFAQRMDKLDRAQGLAEGPGKVVLEAKIATTQATIDALEQGGDERKINDYMFDVLSNLDKDLAVRDYLMGKEPGVVDFVWGTTLLFLRNLGLASMWQGGKFSRVSAYVSRFSQRPAFEKISGTGTEGLGSLFLVSQGFLYSLGEKLPWKKADSAKPSSKKPRKPPEDSEAQD